MRIAVFSDVHGNLPALEAVLADTAVRQVEAVWHLGDFVGYGPFPDEVVRRLTGGDIVNITGNYDLKVLAFPEKRREWRKSKHPLKFLAFQHAYEHLSKDSRRILHELPREIRLTVHGCSVLLIHGSPYSNQEGIGPLTSPQRLAELAELANAQLVCSGHTHQAFTTQVDPVRFVNVGSVGRAVDAPGKACYALLDFQAGSLQVEFRHVPYPHKPLEAALRQAGLPDAFALMFRTARGLKKVLAEAQSNST